MYRGYILSTIGGSEIDMNGQMSQLGHHHLATEGRLFIDSSKTNIISVLFHNRHKLPCLIGS